MGHHKEFHFYTESNENSSEESQQNDDKGQFLVFDASMNTE